MGLAVGGPELGGPVERQVLSPSVQMWTDYFPQARIYGFDISDFSHMKHPRFAFVQGDSGIQHDVEKLVAAAPYFDVILDDASHASYHQRLALKCLWPKLAIGGLYIIEDLHWQSPVFENSLPPVQKTASFLNQLFERNEYDENPLIDRAFASRLQSEVQTFSSFPSFDGSAGPTKLIVLRKKRALD
jgi:hypothetical protein